MAPRRSNAQASTCPSLGRSSAWRVAVARDTSRDTRHNGNGFTLQNAGQVWWRRRESNRRQMTLLRVIQQGLRGTISMRIPRKVDTPEPRVVQLAIQS
jgi:hypothetical protein